MTDPIPIPSSSSSSFIVSSERSVNMENKEIIFSPTVRLRFIIDKAGNVWFPAREAAILFEYTNTNKAIKDHVEKTNANWIKSLQDILANGDVQGGNETLPPCTFQPTRPCRRRNSPFNKNELKAKYINEAGLYSLAMRSKLQAAIPFQRWVCEEVLPEIRRIGTYLGRRPISPPPYSSITKAKCNVITNTISNPCRHDYSVLHDLTNQIGLSTHLSTAEIKRQNNIHKGLSIPDVMNDDAQERRILADYLFGIGLRKKKEQISHLPSHARFTQYHAMADEIRSGVNAVPYIGENIGILPNDVAKKRKKEQLKQRKEGILEASARAWAMTTQMQKPLINAMAN